MQKKHSLRTMITEKFSKTTSLLLIATMTLALASTVSAADPAMPSAIGEDGLPVFLDDGVGDDTLELITFFLFLSLIHI